MKKIIIIVAVILALVIAIGTYFKGTVVDTAKNKAIETALDKTALSDEAKGEILEAVKEVDAKVIAEFMKDPEEFAKGTSETAKDFLNSPEGKKMIDLYNKYKSELQQQ